jgi:nitrogen fixation NifU-like protein
MMNYSKIVLKHFRNPHNLGKIVKPDGVGEVGNMACGDVMRLYIKVKNDRIEDIKFETYDYEQVIKDLGGLPPIKVHCSLLAIDALDEAIYEYLVKNKREIPKDLEIKHQKILTRGRH